MALNIRNLDLDHGVNFERFLQASPDAIVVIDLADSVTFINGPAAEVLANSNAESVGGGRWGALFPASVHSDLAAAIATARSGDYVHLDLHWSLGAGETYWQITIAPLVDAAGAACAVMLWCRDITSLIVERQAGAKREASLKAQAAALRSAGAIAKVGGWEIDFRAGRVRMSPETWELLGGEPRELTLPEVLEIYVPADRERIGRLIESSRRTGERLSLQAEATRANGDPIWIDVIGEPDFVDGVCTHLRGVLQDVSAMKAMVESLRNTEHRLTLAMEIAQLHVYEVDFPSRTLISQGAEDTFFETPLTADIMWRNPFFGVDPRDLEEAQAAWAASERDGVRYQAEYRVLRSDGREVWAFSTCHLDRDEAGRPRRVIGALQDITRRKQAEAELVAARDAAEAANAAKSAFLANMSHEIRTPLNGVLGMAQVMDRMNLDEDQRKRLAVIRRSGETLMVLLNDLLDLSKIEAGSFVLEDHAFDLFDTLAAACMPMEALAAQKDLLLELEIDDGALGLWRGDAIRLRQVVSNLVANAVKFTHVGAVTVQAMATARGLTITVSDTGIGIPAESLPTLFRRFSQADGSTSRRFGGTGLGLALSRELVELMGGVLALDTVDGVGSTFTASLPLQRATGSLPPRPDRVPQAQFASGATRLRILAAEDNATNQMVLRAILEPAGVDLVVVGNGEDAVRAMTLEPFDLVLMDVQMPVMGGLEATEQIRRQELGKRTPILALTANVMAGQLEEYLAAGMDGLVAKPIEIERLYAAVAAALAGQRPTGADGSSDASGTASAK
ncbi:MAG: ATP-binding protein [Pseudomonadota bacterium]